MNLRVCLGKLYAEKKLYTLQSLPSHLADALRREELRQLLLDFDWMQIKISSLGPQSLISDYDFLPRGSKLRSLQEALYLSVHVLKKDKTQLAAQLLGRLSPSRNAYIGLLRNQIVVRCDKPWLRPLRASLTSPGSPLMRLFEGYPRQMKMVVVVPPNRFIAIGESSSIVLGALDTGSVIRTLTGHAASVESIAVTDDGRFLASNARDGPIKIWDLNAGKVIRNLKTSAHPETVVLARDGGLLVAGCEDGTLEIWKFGTGELLHRLYAHGSEVTALAISSDGNFVFSGSRNHWIQGWDLLTGDHVLTLIGHDSDIEAIAATNDSHFLVSASRDTTVRIWDLETGTTVKRLEGHTDYVDTVEVTADNQHVISGSSWDKTLRIWDLRTGKLLRSIEGYIERECAIAISKDGHFAIVGSWDGTIKLLNLDATAPVLHSDSHKDAVSVLAFAPHSRRIVSGSWDGTLRIWDVQTGELLSTLGPHKDLVRIVSITENERFIFSATKNEIRVWDLETSRELRRWYGYGDWIDGIIAAKEPWLVVSHKRYSEYTEVQVSELKTKKVLYSFRESHMGNLVVTRDGRIAIYQTLSGTMRVRDLHKGEVVHTLRYGDGYSERLALTKDAHFAISGLRAYSKYKTNTVYVWDLQTGKIVRRWDCKDNVEAVAISEDGQHAAIGEAKTVRVWDLESNVVVASFTGESTIWRCLVLPLQDGLYVIAGESSGRVHFLRLEGI